MSCLEFKTANPGIYCWLTHRARYCDILLYSEINICVLTALACEQAFPSAVAAGCSLFPTPAPVSPDELAPGLNREQSHDLLLLIVCSSTLFI